MRDATSGLQIRGFFHSSPLEAMRMFPGGSSPEAVGKMAVRHRRDAGLHWSATLAGIERVKHLYQAEIRASREEDD
ncbi:TPA: hypothetical protein N2G38_004738 [Salmonella enterica]|nr:hypothetical protein [Salmonella enterica]